MEVSESLFSNYAPTPTGKLLLTCQATRVDEGDVTVALYDSYLVESSSRSKAYLLFDFDVKFAFSTPHLCITFEKNEHKASYALRSAADLQQWR
jgi:hypothetical protein